MLIGFVGNADAGKSRAATYLRERHGFAVVSPIDPAKKFVGELFGFSERQLFGPSSAREEPHPVLKRPDGSPLTARFVLDELGVSLRRVCPSILADYSMRDADRDLVNESVRFHEEMELIRARGGRIVLRTGGTPTNDAYDQLVRTLPRSAYDAVIEPLPTLAELYERLDILLSGWRSERDR